MINYIHFLVGEPNGPHYEVSPFLLAEGSTFSYLQDVYRVEGVMDIHQAAAMDLIGPHELNDLGIGPDETTVFIWSLYQHSWTEWEMKLRLREKFRDWKIKSVIGE